MGWLLRKQEEYDPEVLLKDYEQAIAELVEAVLNQQGDVDLKLAELVENANAQARVAIVEKLRELVAVRDAEKAKALDAFAERQKQLLKMQKQNLMQQWLAHVMSQETLRKIRESLIHTPGLQAQLKNIGKELTEKGVLHHLNPGGKKDLGELNATVQHQRDQTRGKDSGRGV